MKTVRLTGRLAKLYGKSFSLDIASPAEAVRALCFVIPGFENEIRKGYYRVYRSYDDGRMIEYTERDLHFQSQKASCITIEPVPTGRKSGFLNVIIGAVLVGAAFMLTGGTLAAPALSFFGTTITGTQLALVGGLMAVSGIASMLSPTPKMNTDDTKERRSAILNPPENRTEAGHPVPLVYGKRVFIGSTVIANALTVEEFDDGE